MLVQLLPEQIGKHWDEIKSTLERTLPPVTSVTDDTMNNILQQALSGEVQVWVVSDEGKVMGLVITTIVEEFVSGSRNLLIYSVYGYSFISEGLWRNAVEKLRGFASGSGCHKIIGYTKVKRIIDIVQMLGGSAESVLISLEVDNGGS